MNGDQTEAFGGKRVAQHLRNPRRYTVRIAREFSENQLAGLCSTDVTNLRIETRLFVDRFEPETPVFAALDDAQYLGAPFFKLFDDMRRPTVAAFFGARQDPVANPQSAAFTLSLNHADLGHSNAFGLPMLWHRDRMIAVNRNNFEDGDLGHTAHFVKGPARSHVNEALIRHILQQGFQRNLLISAKSKFPRDLTLARRIF